VSRIECNREQDILDAVASGRWPERVDAELMAHAKCCRICTEVAMVSMLYQEDYSAALEEARVPSSGLVWWKSELRSRQEAVRAASRPIEMVQGVSVVCVVSVLLIALALLSSQFDLGAISTFIHQQPLILWLVMGVVAALTPVALYFVYSGE
jgi:hypothetical protein